LTNINRWRGQLGLEPITAADLPKQVSTFEAGGVKGTLMDATSANKAKRLVAISLPKPDGTWFYKLTGDEPAVAAQKEAFIQFVQSAK
jgi:hypothetical protein